MVLASPSTSLSTKALHTFENPAADDRVLLYDGKLFVCQPARLLQDAVCNADLADVMQERSNSDPFDIIRAETHGGGCRAGKLADA